MSALRYRLTHLVILAWSDSVKQNIVSTLLRNTLFFVHPNVYMSALKEIKEQFSAKRFREGSKRPTGNYESGCLICWCLPIQHFKKKNALLV